MPTRNVVLTDRHEKLIESLVSSGRFQNASEVLREGLRLVEKHMAEEAAKLKAFREAVDVGLRDLEEGRYLEFESFDDLDSYLKDMFEAILREPLREPEA